MNKRFAKALIALVLTGGMACGIAGCGLGGNNGNEENGEIYSVYQSYAANVQSNGGEVLSYEQWLASIKGADGKDGADGVTPTISINDDGYWVINGNVTDVKATGDDGVDGENGKDGVGIEEVYIDEDGNLIVKLTNGVEKNCGAVVSNSTEQVDGTEGLVYAAVKEDGEIIGYNVRGIGTAEDMDLVIPSTYKGKPVLGIYPGAFYNPSPATTIKSVIIPEGITNIGNYAFFGCESLTDVVIPDSVTYIGESAFSYCSSLIEITIPYSVTYIGESAFSGCSSLIEINIPKSVTTIGNGTFMECSSLREITIPESVTNIGYMVFLHCSTLTAIHYAGTVEQWNEIGGNNSNWINNEDSVVICSDGQITREG